MSQNTQPSYEPELGQALFGQPSQELECPMHVLAVLRAVAQQWEVLRGQDPNPFDNTGAFYECEGLSIQAYPWNEEACQPWNLRWEDVEISWYKYLGRGMSINKDVSVARAQELKAACLRLLPQLTSL
jgi:hypothetical protein